MHRRPHRLLRKFSTTATTSKKNNVTLGIRREDPQRIWERRTPLTPEAVHYLVSQKNVSVDVERCDRRVFPDSEYIKAGATIKPALNDAHIIIGIKETPLPELITTPIASPSSANGPRERTHLMFSHTIKGQTYNTPLLGRFVGPSSQGPNPLSSRLIDYELLTNEADGKRSVGFGWFAGVAGVLESLSAMAHSHLTFGIASPFLYTPRPHTHPSLDSLRAALRDIGRQIAEEGTPQALGPFVIGVTGTGKVSQGCLDILQELPIENVKVVDLHRLVTNPDTDLRKIYLVHAKAEDYLIRADVAPTDAYDRTHYYANPGSYKSIFANKVAPYLTLFLNGTGWSPSFPRLMTNEQLRIAMEEAEALGGFRFRNVGDISCDVEGGLQFLTRATTLSDPFYTIYPPAPGQTAVTESSATSTTSNVRKAPAGVNMMSVDILPASLPLDASRHFSKVLLPYLEEVLGWYTGETEGREAGEARRALDRATVAKDGKLVGKHTWLQGDVDKWYQEKKSTAMKSSTAAAASLPSGSSGVSPGTGTATTATKTTGSLPNGGMRKKRVLMLGSGMVAGPAVDEIAKRKDVKLVIASNMEAEAQKLSKGKENVQYQVIDISNEELVERLVEESDVVISLLPVAFHVSAAELCIKHKKHLVTASYISPEMRQLHDRATQADILLLNEIGLDPGIDHCSALDIIDRLHQEKKYISSFTSFCGGLPAPDVDPSVPLRYKFSWSPRGVLAAALNPARFRLGGETMNIRADKLLRKAFRRVPITKEFELEGIPNRDSLPYADTYGIRDAATVLRGTLRYPGFASLMEAFQSIGFLDTHRKIKCGSWTDFLPYALGLSRETKHEAGAMINNRVNEKHRETLLSALRWLSLLGQQNPSMPPIPIQPMAPIDVFAYLLAHRLKYEPHERDMVVLHHEFIVPVKNQGERSKHVQEEEVYTSQLIVYGNSKASAMARTVGIPVALAALLVLDGKVGLRGVQGPMDQSIYRPVLSGLEEAGLGMKEEKRVVKVLNPEFETVEAAIASASL